MRTITSRYSGACEKCGAAFEAGAEIAYEKSTGTFCPDGCAPTDPEEIRAYRQEAADRKADRYQGWADTRKAEATATLDTISARYRGDVAFNTQPGDIPERVRVIRREDRAFESLTIAEGLERKARSLRHVRVAGDAERKRQAVRDANDGRIQVGSRVHDFCFGAGVVTRVNRLTYTVQFASGGRYARDKSFVHPLMDEAAHG